MAYDGDQGWTCHDDPGLSDSPNGVAVVLVRPPITTLNEHVYEAVNLEDKICVSKSDEGPSRIDARLNMITIPCRLQLLG